MKKFLPLMIALFVSGNAWAQKFSVTGQVMDTLSSPLPSSTVMLLSGKDSTLVNFGITDLKGVFELKNINAGEYFIKITFVGYAPFIKRIETPAGGSILDMGKIKMEPLTKKLEEVVIRAEKAPVTVKKDTIEFDAGSFKVKANATVEDLLKKLPGVEVETDGTVRAQGEQVQKVTVDGREFFGRDPKLATRNLPADAVDKVQVFDKKSDQALFTGIEDGQREKTINLELKEDKRNGAFGTLMAGAGTNDRFQARASINKFSKGKQLSFLGMGNNINEQGFSIDDYMNFTGGSQQMMSGGGGGRVQITMNANNQSGMPLNFGGRQSGIMTNYAGGVNFNRDINKNTQLNSSYFYNRLDQNITRELNRINYLPNGNYTFNQNSRQLSNNDNHRANLMLDHRIDSANSLKFTASANYSESEQRTQSNSQTMTIDNTLQNESDRFTYNRQNNFNLNANLLWRHRFAKKGRSFSSNLTFGVTQTDNEGTLQSTNWFYNTSPGEQLIEQTNTQSTGNLTYGATLSYIEPLGGRKYLEASYNFRTNQNDVDREVYDVNGGTPTFNDLLSNEFTSHYIYNRPGLSFRMNRQKYSLTAGASYQNTLLKGDLISRQVTIDRTFENFLPVVRFNYDFSNFKHLRLDYETSIQEPGIQQLQPVIDNSDPLNIYVGNPELKPSYSHNASLNFTTFDPAKFVNFFAFVRMMYALNAITNSQTVSPNLVRFTKPVNVKDNLNLSANMNFGFPIKKLNSRINVGPSASLMRTINILNDQENHIDQQTWGGNARYNFTYKEIFTLDVSANLSYQETHYEFNTQQDQVYFNKTYSAESNLNFLKNYSFNTSFDYMIYESRTTGFSQRIPFLNISVSRFVMKNNAGEIRLGVNNLLDQSLSVTQSATANYLQQERTNNLGRFFMLSFTYALNKQLNPMGGMRRGPGGGRMMMIRQ
jgi:outer membrane receptor protein involved in Fe transport